MNESQTMATASSAAYEYQIDAQELPKRSKAASMYFQAPNSIRKDINFYLQPSLKREKEKAKVENAKSQYALERPLKSACFDTEMVRPPATASLKERIKRNKILTFSPKTGSLVGVNPNKTRRDEGFMNLRNVGVAKGENQLSVNAKQFLSARGSTNAGGKLVYANDKGRIHFASGSSRDMFNAKT